MNDQMIDQAIAMILSERTEKWRVDVVNEIARSVQSAKNFVRALIAKKLETNQNLEVVLSDIHRLFERLAEYSVSSACIFMAHLWPVASLWVGLHDVCDSIDLWLANNPGPEVKHHLVYLASSADAESVRRHFRDFAG